MLGPCNGMFFKGYNDVERKINLTTQGDNGGRVLRDGMLPYTVLHNGLINRKSRARKPSRGPTFLTSEGSIKCHGDYVNPWC